MGVFDAVKEFEEKSKDVTNMGGIDVDFNINSHLEIKSSTDDWISVNAFAFRSYTGERRVDGKPYEGPVYILGTNERKTDVV